MVHATAPVRTAAAVTRRFQPTVVGGDTVDTGAGGFRRTWEDLLAGGGAASSTSIDNSRRSSVNSSSGGSGWRPGGIGYCPGSTSDDSRLRVVHGDLVSFDVYSAARTSASSTAATARHSFRHHRQLPSVSVRVGAQLRSSAPPVVDDDIPTYTWQQTAVTHTDTPAASAPATSSSRSRLSSQWALDALATSHTGRSSASSAATAADRLAESPFARLEQIQRRIVELHRRSAADTNDQSPADGDQELTPAWALAEMSEPLLLRRRASDRSSGAIAAARTTTLMPPSPPEIIDVSPNQSAGGRGRPAFTPMSRQELISALSRASSATAPSRQHRQQQQQQRLSHNGNNTASALDSDHEDAPPPSASFSSTSAMNNGPTPRDRLAQRRSDWRSRATTQAQDAAVASEFESFLRQPRRINTNHTGRVTPSNAAPNLSLLSQPAPLPAVVVLPGYVFDNDDQSIANNNNNNNTVATRRRRLRPTLTAAAGDSSDEVQFHSMSIDEQQQSDVRHLR